MAVAVWRIWFYVLMVVPIVIMLPFLLIFTSSERFYPQYYFCARIWAKSILYGMGLYPVCKSPIKLKNGNSYMLVANHTSMIDIMLMLAVVKHPFIFVGKKELARIPLFGFFYRRTCILVDRNCNQSKHRVFSEAQRRLNQGNSICIFPEGGVPEDHALLLDNFKDGAFRIAIDYQIPIVPFTFYDNKKRFPYRFSIGGPGPLRVKAHDMIPTEGKSQGDRRELKLRTRQLILEDLQTMQN
ncbi:MAG: lysophospholipid acyltransferase family protein [Bacteroidota bacterium]